MLRRTKIIIKLIGLCIVSLFAFFFCLLFSMRISRRHYQGARRSAGGGVDKRRFPYPFKSALTICSDIDGTSSLHEFVTIQEYLNTENHTDMGVGLGLEIGSSIIPGEAAATRADSHNVYDIDNDLVIDLIKAGYIDSIHSFDQASRHRVTQLAGALTGRDCRFKVWINHANASTNLGDNSGAYPALGDKSNKEYYHTDFTLRDLGINFVWTGRVTGIVGQGVPLRLRSFFAGLHKDHMIKSLVNNSLKEMSKYSLSVLDVTTKYSDRKYNDLVYPLRLGDGQYVFDFVRSNISWLGVGRKAAKSPALCHTLRGEIFDELCRIGGYMIVYTHFGGNDGYPYIPSETRRALRSLETEHRRGNIYVTTTAKLLTYYVNNKYLVWRSTVEGGRTHINISCISDPVRGRFVPDVEDLRGITFYTDDPESTHVYIKENEVKEITINDKDDTGRASIMIPLKRLPRIDERIREYKRRHPAVN